VTGARILHTAASALALVALSSPLWLAHPAHAQRRDFVGRVVSITPQSLEVKDRRGNTVAFTRHESTAVEGKSGWDAIVAGDQVLVRWHLGDGVAHHVIVIEQPPRTPKR